MKIGKTADVAQTEAIARTGQATQATGNPSDRAGAGAVRTGGDADQVQLSQTSRNLAAETAAASDLVRADKVDEVRDAISKGDFHVNAKAVADKMIAQAAELVETLTLTNPTK